MLILCFALILIVLVILISKRPDEFRVTRTALISAPASAVFANVNDLHKWNAWSPWAKLDPATKGNFRRTRCRNRRDLPLGRQQQSRRRKHDDHGKPSE